MCRIYNFYMPTQGQGHNWRSEYEPLISCQLHIFFTPWRIFVILWSNVCLSETMCRTHYSTMQTRGQGHNWMSNFLPMTITYKKITYTSSRLSSAPPRYLGCKRCRRLPSNMVFYWKSKHWECRWGRGGGRLPEILLAFKTDWDLRCN